MKFIKWILNGLAGCIVFWGAGMVILRMSGILPYAVLSGSMETEIAAGGMVFTDTKERQPKEGDIITYRLNGTTVTHRVLCRSEEGYITKGDANQGEDANPVLPSQIVGTVCFSLPVLGFVVSYLQKHTTILVMIVVFASTFLLESMPVMRRQIPSTEKNEKGERNKKCAEK